MTDCVKQETSSSKVYYVNRRAWQNRFRGPGRGMVQTLAEAGRYTLLEAAEWASDQKGYDRSVEVVRIEETPGPSTIRLVSTRVIDATKPVVIFDGECASYVTAGFGERRLGTGGSLKQAKVFSDVNDALTALQRHRLAIAQLRAENLDLKIHQVEIIPGTPVITETVLA